ncbi:MAG: ribbon-helix-helix protein, CopG family [Dehalococcoidia bacterium]|jgi:predicted transcriptional regulator
MIGRVSFTIDEERLQQLDALAKELDRDRSSTLRQLIDAGIPVLKAAQKVRASLTRAPLPEAAFPNADADLMVA